MTTTAYFREFDGTNHWYQVNFSAEFGGEHQLIGYTDRRDLIDSDGHPLRYGGGGRNHAKYVAAFNAIKAA